MCVSQGGTCYSVFGEGEWIESRGSGWKIGKEGWKRSVPNRGVTCGQMRTEVRTGAKCLREDAENRASERTSGNTSIYEVRSSETQVKLKFHFA